MSKKCTTSSIQHVTNGTSAVQGLTTKLSAFGNTFLEGIVIAAPLTPILVLLPLHKTRAILHAQELEKNLDNRKLVVLICIFQLDVNTANTYIVIKCLGLCKAWIEDILPAM